MKHALVVYVDIPDGDWIGEAMILSKKRVERTLKRQLPDLVAEVSFLPAELHSLVTPVDTQ